MFGLDNLFAQTSAQKFYISRDRIAEILRVSPDALDAFEKAYSKAALQTEPESIFEVNSRQAAAKNERLGDDSPEAGVPGVCSLVSTVLGSVFSIGFVPPL